MATIFAFDAEVNGLYGTCAAIGATVRDNGAEIAQFQGRLPDEMFYHPRVLDRSFAACRHMPVTHRYFQELEEDFWEFLMAHRHADDFMTHCGMPVEAGLLRRCVERDGSRTYNAPYPIHDVGTPLRLLGEDPRSVDSYNKKFNLKVPDGQAHDPYWDAVVMAICWEHATARLTNRT